MNANELLKSLQVVVISGGSSSRLAHRTGSNTQKALLKLKGHALIEYCLKPFTDAGCKDFVFLLGVGGEKVKEFVEKRKLVPSAKFFVEKTKLGKGGAMKNALDSGLIDRKRPCITIFPDDLFLDRELPKKIAEAHLRGRELGCKATVIRIEKTRYPYGWVECDERCLVTHFEEKPWIPFPANSGIFLFEPEAYAFFDRLVDLARAPVELEVVVIPELVKHKLLYAITVPFEVWIPVNDEKEYQNALKALEKTPLF